MKQRKLNGKRTIALLLVFALCLAVLPFAAFADDALIDFSKTDGSITVTKYANISTTAPKGVATGTADDQPGIDPSYTPLNGAKFVLFQIAGKDAVKDYYNGTNDTAYTLAAGRFVYTDETTATYDGVAAVHMGTLTTSGTGADAGKCKFSNLPVGIYVLKEITAPDQITTPLAEDSLISIPMVNTATSSNNGNAKWIYNVFVYPKNHESTGTVELTKVDQNNVRLANVVFELYKKEFLSNGELTTDPWELVTTTTDNNGTPTTLTLQTNAAGQITLANLPANLYGTQYKLVEVYKAGTSPEGYIINSNPLYFKVNKDNTMSWNAPTGEKGDCNNTNTGVTATAITTDPKLSITLRNELPSLTKAVQENGGSSWKTDEQYRLDDEITYRLIAYVPNNITEISYAIKDMPEVGITDSGDSGDYTVTYGATADTCTTALTSDKYDWSSIGASGSNGQGFMLELTDGTVAGKFIKIVYKAHMNANAVIAGNGNGNTATLTYSKYIGGPDTTTYDIKDEARVYTYQYKITKYKDSVDDANKIGGVQFELLDSSSHTMSVFALPDPGVYRLALAGETGTTTLTTAADGTILVKGLENGTYYLKETKTIDGYNLLGEPFEIVLNVTETTTWTPGSGFTATGEVIKTYGSTGYTVTDAMGTSTIINKKGFVLPQTGGMGYLLFCTAGIILVAGGTLLLFSGRKKRIR